MTKKTKKKEFLKQHGGKKLGHGTYGCVISPPAKCKTHHNFRNNSYKIDNKHVSKLIDFRYNKSGFSELNIGQKLLKIDPKHHHFSPYFNGCFFSPQRHKDIVYLNPDETAIITSPYKTSKSDSLSSEFKSKTKSKTMKSSLIRSQLVREFKDKCILNMDHTYLNLIGPYGGTTLTNIIALGQNNDRAIYFKTNYWYVATYLINGLRIMHRNKIVHRDIKPSNITIDFSFIRDASLAFKKSTPIETCRATFIDFGLAKEIKKNKYSYDEARELLGEGTQHYIPIEIFAIKILIKLISRGYESDNDQFLKKMISKSISKVKRNMEYYHYSGFRNDFFKYNKDPNEKNPKDDNFYMTEKKIEQIFANVLDLHKQGNLQKTISSIIYGWDIFSLGIVLAKIALKFNIIDNEFTTLIFNMIRLDPHKRPTVKTLIRHPKYLMYIKYITKEKLSNKIYDSEVKKKISKI